MAKTHPLGVVILAAGQASRFGSAKQLALYRDESLLSHCLTICADLSAPIFVVTGAHKYAVHAHLINQTISHSVLHNASWADGLSSSIGCAVEHCAQAFNALLFVAADQAKLTQQDVHTLVQCWQQDPRRTACACYQNQMGIPAIFPRSQFTDLLALSGDRGAKKLLQHTPHLLSVPLPNAAVDIDTPQQLARLCRGQ